MFKPMLTLWKRHVSYLEIIVKHEVCLFSRMPNIYSYLQKIRKSDLEDLESMCFDVRKRGHLFYSQYLGGHDKHWITINSHMSMHLPLCIKRFGCIRNTWVFAFESALGISKRYNADHKNGLSEGKRFILIFKHLMCLFRHGNDDTVLAFCDMQHIPTP